MISKHSLFRVSVSEAAQPKAVVFFFAGMGMRLGMYQPFIRFLLRKGYSCVAYDYPIRIMWSGDVKVWRQLFDTVIADAQRRLAEYSEQGIKDFITYGNSMGTLVANKFCRDEPKVSKLVLNLTYGDVAYSIWTYRMMHPAKRKLQRQSIDEAALRQALRYCDPIVTAPGLKDKPVLLYLSRTDKVLPYHQTQRTRQAFEQAGVRLTYVENRWLGHYLGGAKNFLAKRALLEFLEAGHYENS